jgi:anti-anti-sigma factor
MQLRVLSFDEHGVVRVQCEGNISQQHFQPGVDPLESVLGPMCWNHKILLNMEKTGYIDSSGVSWLIVCHKKCREHKGNLVIYGVPPVVKHILKLLRMDLLLQIAETEAAAHALVRGVAS